MNGPQVAAQAVRDALPQRGVFPAVGQVASCKITRGSDGAVNGFSQFSVRVNGVVEDCLWSGSMMVEAQVTGSKMVGRDVSVAYRGGELVAEYTINGSV